MKPSILHAARLRRGLLLTLMTSLGSTLGTLPTSAAAQSAIPLATHRSRKGCRL